jgi:hypothetical protein
MNDHSKLISDFICEQIVIQEDLYRSVERQLSEINNSSFSEASTLLQGIKTLLEEHYQHLNDLLDQFDIQEEKPPRIRLLRDNAASNATLSNTSDSEQRIGLAKLISMFRQNHLALSQIAFNNSFLYTMALALNYEEAAAVALLHLQTVAPLVFKTGDILPDMVMRELLADAMEISPDSASIALKNLQAAWRSSF